MLAMCQGNVVRAAAAIERKITRGYLLDACAMRPNQAR